MVLCRSARGVSPDDAEAHVDRLRGVQPAGRGEDHAAADLGGGDAAEVDGGTGAGLGAVDALLVALEAADASREAGGFDDDRFADLERAVDQGAGDDGSEAGDREGAVDWQARAVDVADIAEGVNGAVEGGAEVVETGPGDAGAGDDRCVGEAGGAQQVVDIVGDEFEPLLVDEVGLGQRDDALLEVEQVEDVEVLAGLGHDALIGGDHEQGEVDAADAGEHVLDKALVAGDVDDRDFASAGQCGPGEAEIDREAAGFFFFPAIGVDAAERQDQGALAVVDVPGGADDEHDGSLGGWELSRG